MNPRKKYRLERQITQAQLAQAINVHQINISEWEHGATPDSALLAKLSHFFGVPEEALMTKKEIMERAEKRNHMSKLPYNQKT